jgi:hypothetical protein
MDDTIVLNIGSVPYLNFSQVTPQNSSRANETPIPNSDCPDNRGLGMYVTIISDVWNFSFK